MQVLKNDVREAILSAAKKLFLVQGFSAVSLRAIAKDASLTPGNLYRYFSDKEDIFRTLVGPLVLFFDQMLTHEPEALDHDSLQSLFDMHRNEFQHFVSALFDFKDELSLLFEKSTGSAYEHEYARITSLMAGHFSDHLLTLGIDTKRTAYGPFCEILSHTFLQGLVKIVQLPPTRTSHNMLLYLLRFYVDSIRSFIPLFGENDENTD